MARGSVRARVFQHIAMWKKPKGLTASRRLWRSAPIAAVAAVGFLLVLNFMQTAMIFPGAATQGRPENEVRPPAGTELLHLRTARGEAVAALFGPALAKERPHADASRRPTLIYFYGNGMCLADSLAEFDRFRRLGVNVLIPDYVGYGMSSGQPSEQALYATADAGYAHLRTRPGIEPRRIIAAGWSLGGAVAIDLAHRHPVGGLMVFSAFTSTVDMARRLLPLLPHSLLVRHRFENLRKIAEIRVPTFIAHGRRDSIIPYAMSEKLARAAAGRPLVFLPIAAADHNDFFEKADADLTPALAGFVESLPR